jgi:hypothetical protein
MNCKETKEKMWDYLLEDNYPQEFEKHLADCSDCCAEFEQLLQTLKTIKPKLKVSASNIFSLQTINKLKKEEQKMKKRVPFYLKIAASILVLFATSFLLIYFNPNSNAQVPASTINQVLTESIKELKKNKSMRMEMKVRTLERDNFEYIGDKYEFLTHYIKVEFSPKKWIIQKRGRTVLFDGENQYLDIDGQDYIIKAGADAGFVGWFQIFFTPDKILEIEQERAKKDGSNYELKETKKHFILTVKQKAQGDFTNDYLYHSSVTESDNKRVFYFDKKTSQLLHFELYIIQDNYENLIMRSLAIIYNETFNDYEFSEKVLQNKPIKNIADFEPKSDEELINETPEGIARIFLEAFANEDWETAKKIFPGCSKLFIKQYERLEVLEIGTAFKSGEYGGVFVPYTIKLSNGHYKSFNLALRNDNVQKIWQFDGGM